MWHVRKYPFHEVWFTLLIHHRMHYGVDVCIKCSALLKPHISSNVNVLTKSTIRLKDTVDWEIFTVKNFSPVA